MLYYFIVKAECYHSPKLLKLEVTSATDSAESFWVIVYHLHMHIHLHTQARIRFTSFEYSSVLLYNCKTFQWVLEHLFQNIPSICLVCYISSNSQGSVKKFHYWAIQGSLFGFGSKYQKRKFWYSGLYTLYSYSNICFVTVEISLYT